MARQDQVPETIIGTQETHRIRGISENLSWSETVDKRSGTATVLEVKREFRAASYLDLAAVKIDNVGQGGEMNAPYFLSLRTLHVPSVRTVA
jgi:hypothetical protein